MASPLCKFIVCPRVTPGWLKHNPISRRTHLKDKVPTAFGYKEALGSNPSTALNLVVHIWNPST